MTASAPRREPATGPGSPPVLRFDGVSKSYGSPRAPIRALSEVSLDIALGETVGLVGESGSGKSTFARLALGMEQPTAGTVEVSGRRATSPGIGGAAQMVFQDPAASLDPMMTVADSVAEPLSVRRELSRSARAARVDEVLAEVRLGAELRQRVPTRLSGGQKQRASIARALTTAPPLIVCDEAVTALDVSVRAQVLNLLRQVQADYGSALLFISHDLSTVAYMSDRIMVLYLGRVMEIGATADILARPAHPYTAVLLSAVPRMQQGRLVRPRIPLTGEAPSLADPPLGCPFSTRCPAATDLCRHEVPALTAQAGGTRAACHFPYALEGWPQ